jgi:uncharacterized protein YkwD
MRRSHHAGSLLLALVTAVAGCFALSSPAGAAEATSTAGDIVVPASAVHADSVDPADAAAQFFHLLNTERADAGLPNLQRDPGLDAVALDWSGHLDAAGQLSHRPSLGTALGEVEPRWLRGGENVGVGGDVASLHAAFMASAPHRANVLGDFNRVGVGVVDGGDRIWVTFDFLKGPDLTPAVEAPLTASAAPGASWVVTADGQVRAIGGAPHFGDLTGTDLARPIVGMAATPSGNGYWLVASDGGIFAFGDAGFFGSTGAVQLNKPIVGMASTATGKGYWLVASDGGIFAFGDAGFFGSTGAVALNRPIVGMAATDAGHGYWLVASDGGIFSFGDAPFHGSTGGSPSPAGVRGITATPSGDGYWILDADGTVHAFGDAPDAGSAPASGGPYTRIAATADGLGYRLAAADGRVFSFGSAGSGASGPLGLSAPIVALANR